MNPLWWIVLLAPYVTFAVIRLRSWTKARRAARDQARRDAERRARLPVSDGCGLVFRNFSVYANGVKLGTAESHSFCLTEIDTSLIVNQLVPGDKKNGGSEILREAFVTGEKVEIYISPLDGETIQFGQMSVVSIDCSTSCKTGTTRLVASLVGAALKKPRPVQSGELPPDLECEIAKPLESTL